VVAPLGSVNALMKMKNDREQKRGEEVKRRDATRLLFGERVRGFRHEVEGSSLCL
jgi:hypothetical protein